MRNTLSNYPPSIHPSPSNQTINEALENNNENVYIRFVLISITIKPSIAYERSGLHVDGETRSYCTSMSSFSNDLIILSSRLIVGATIKLLYSKKKIMFTVRVLNIVM